MLSARAAGRDRRRPFRQARACPASSTRTSIIRRPASSAPTARNCSTGCTNTPSSKSRSSPIPATRETVARFFLDELFRQGTTTALVYCTVHPQSVDAFFAESERRGARMIAGKVMMDRNAPPALTDTPQRGYDESKALIARWRGRGRLDYAITPRFAVTSTEAQLEAAGALAREYPRRLRADAPRREPRRDRASSNGSFPWARDLSRRLRRATACSGRARCSAIASISRNPRSPRWRAAVRSPPSARPPTCFSAPACST